ncbi:hypothetical protein F5146DRAFT_995412 [Armillaria mellea]|nr:hypothetical protein F5146DRAFT_995412 [Armillaria mellea]
MPVQCPSYNNDAPKARPPKPTDLSNIKCYCCGEMGHYASFHDKDANPCIRAAHTTIGNDVYEDGDDDDSIVENGPSEGEPENFEPTMWQEVEFEEYGEEFDSRDNDGQEFMGMTYIIDTPDPYNGSSKPNSDPEDEWSSDEPDSPEYRVMSMHKTQISVITEEGNEDWPTNWYKLKITTKLKDRPIPTIEVLDREDMGKTANPLPHNSPAIMMAKMEFSIEGYSTNDDCNVTPSISDLHEPYVHDNIPTVGHNHEFNSGETGINHNSIKVEALDSITHNYNKYQPTSSQVLVEDLVTNDDDDDDDDH